MKQFRGLKAVKEIKKQCELEALPFNDDALKSGDDYISFGWVDWENDELGFGTVVLHYPSGRFFVYDEAGILAGTEASEDLDCTEWYYKLLDFVYTHGTIYRVKQGCVMPAMTYEKTPIYYPFTFEVMSEVDASGSVSVKKHSSALKYTAQLSDIHECCEEVGISDIYN